MKLSSLINFQNAEELSQILRTAKDSRERFSLDLSEAECANAIYAGMKAEIEDRGRSIILDEDTRSHILEAARWLINPNSSPGLLLCGLYGNGKTTLAKAIARIIEYLTEHELGYSHRMAMRLHTAKDICRMCVASEKFKEQYNDYDRLGAEPMMIIDDLGEEPKEVMVYGMPHTPLIDLISKRYEYQCMTIITTNLDVDALKEKYGERIFDRFREMLTSIVFENDSYRSRKTDSQMDHTRC